MSSVLGLNVRWQNVLNVDSKLKWISDNIHTSSSQQKWEKSFTENLEQPSLLWSCDDGDGARLAEDGRLGAGISSDVLEAWLSLFAGWRLAGDMDWAFTLNVSWPPFPRINGRLLGARLVNISLMTCCGEGVEAFISLEQFVLSFKPVLPVFSGDSGFSGMFKIVKPEF